MEVIHKKVEGEISEIRLIRPGYFDYTFQSEEVVFRLIWKEKILSIIVGDDEKQNLKAKV